MITWSNIRLSFICSYSIFRFKPLHTQLTHLLLALVNIFLIMPSPNGLSNRRTQLLEIAPLVLRLAPGFDSKNSSWGRQRTFHDPDWAQEAEGSRIQAGMPPRIYRVDRSRDVHTLCIKIFSSLGFV
jgi:hypothetical protein